MFATNTNVKKCVFGPNQRNRDQRGSAAAENFMIQA
jgi:hypothetical protein